jgi:hypothetical protein
MGAEVCTGAHLAALVTITSERSFTCGFLLAASADEAERAKTAMAMNDRNLVIIFSPEIENQSPEHSHMSRDLFPGDFQTPKTGFVRG